MQIRLELHVKLIFSSDRTITDYATEIWGAEPQPGYRIPGPSDARPGTE